MKKPNLQKYFQDTQAYGIVDHEIRATDNGENVLFYIHPKGFNGVTLDFSVTGNELTQLHISPEDDFRKYLYDAMEGRSIEQLREVARTLGV